MIADLLEFLVLLLLCLAVGSAILFPDFVHKALDTRSGLAWRVGWALLAILAGTIVLLLLVLLIAT